MEQIVHEIQDMTYLSWAKTRNSSGTAGSFLKAYENSPEGKIYYKLSNYDAWKGIVGHECVNEIIADHLLTLLGVDHISDRKLYESGESLPLALEDFIGFVQHRVVSSNEAARILECSRQNIDDLIRRDKLHPIRRDAKNKLFLRNEVLQRKQHRSD